MSANQVSKNHPPEKNRQLVYAHLSLAKDVLLVVAKAAWSLVYVSVFMLANVLYSSGMGLARLVAIRMHNQEPAAQSKSYRLIGTIIAVASGCYILYSVRLFFGGTTGTYPLHIAVLIALYTFILFGIHVRGAVRLRNSHSLEAKALRAISLSSTLLCFSLTQTALMSAANESNIAFASALSGVFYGALACLLGLRIIKNSFGDDQTDRTN